MSAQAPATRPVHPCILNLTSDGGTRGVEFSCWARCLCYHHNKQQICLVTASACTISIYRIQKPKKNDAAKSYTSSSQQQPQPQQQQPKYVLVVEHVFGDLAGNVVHLSTISGGKDGEDALLVGFAGGNAPRLAVVTVKEQKGLPLLQAETLIDWSAATETNAISFTNNTVDMQACTITTHNNSNTHVACLLGGGMAVGIATIQHHHHPKGGGVAVSVPQEPYMLPLSQLVPSDESAAAAAASASAAATMQQNPTTSSHHPMFTGFGDILDLVFLPNFLEPVLCLLHTELPQGSLAVGRRRPKESGYFLTALSVSSTHYRTAKLWSTRVPCDAFSLLVHHPKSDETTDIGFDGNDLVLVIAANSLTFVQSGDGIIQQTIAFNGWASSQQHQANPLLKLSISLDGSRWVWLPRPTCTTSKQSSSSSGCAIGILRCGQMYVLENLTSEDDNRIDDVQQRKEIWSLLPMGRTLGDIGEVASLVALPVTKADAWWVAEANTNSEGDHSKSTNGAGLLFAGSRLGDSTLMGYGFESNSIPNQLATLLLEQHQQIGTSSAFLNHIQNEENGDVDDIVGLEDRALYAAPTELHQQQGRQEEQQPNVVPASDEENNQSKDKTALSRNSKSQQVSTVSSLTVLDVLSHLGPLGPGTIGPIAPPPVFLTEQDRDNSNNPLEQAEVFGADAHVIPCGYGSSGGLALFTLPGQDDRMIITEEDCANVECIHNLTLEDTGFLCVGMLPCGIRLLRHEKSATSELCEMDPTELCTSFQSGPVFSTLDDMFQQSRLLLAGECDDGTVVFVVQPQQVPFDVCIVLGSNAGNGELSIVRQEVLHRKGNDNNAFLVSVTPMVQAKSSKEVTFGCLWSSGNASIVTASLRGEISEIVVEGKNVDTAEDNMEVEMDELQREAKEMEDFYADKSVVALDIFRAPRAFFDSGEIEASSPTEAATKDELPPKDVPSMKPKTNQETTDWSKLTVVKLKEELKKRGIGAKGKKAVLVAALHEWEEEQNVEVSSPENVGELDETLSSDTKEMDPMQYEYDEEDEELYGISNDPINKSSTDNTAYSLTSTMPDLGDEVQIVSVCRRSGVLEIYSTEEQPGSLTLLWSCQGANLGAPLLKRHTEGDLCRLPKTHKVSVDEIRFFVCGPSSSGRDRDETCRFCLAIRTSEGDQSFYKMEFGSTSCCPVLRRLSLRSVARTSQEQGRHHTKLMRKRIVSKESTGTEKDAFLYNVFHRFLGISGQDGLFAAGPRPYWLVNERGRPSALVHRTRHAAPAGGRPRPVSGFCSGLKQQGGFITLHERVGRVGTQRLTFFNGLSTAFDSNGILLSRGFCAERVSFGVTVHRIAFINDEMISTGEHPLYAVLVSRELEMDQSELNSDGLTDEERERIAAEKDATMIQRQVEADLGGFDAESEWVEKIEREDCFKIDTKLGGAPPIQRSVYSLWIVDAANQWRVVDSYELGEYEIGIDLQLMYLTEFKDDPGQATELIDSDDVDHPKRLFLTLGTGIVTHDGEDVTTKGRALLFEVKLLGSAARTMTSPLAELTVAYEKEIFHGPVTTLSCLSAEGNNRLVIGAGSDVNIEQWGSNGKLTQVGFFRATMHILDILHFKNFLLLCDAFDSIYFLVWRESDKSLTLLAKDYDPISVYAAGIVTRGANMTFVCHDDRENLQFFQYTPGEAAARGGNKLVCRADCHVGSQTTAFLNHYCRPSLLAHSATLASTFSALKQQDPLFGRQDDEQRMGVHFGTTSGALGSIVPLSEPVYWRMMALQSVLANALENHCSLSQRAWRLYRRSVRRGGCRNNDRKKSVIDGDLILRYADLSTPDQEDIASAIGSTVGLILDNLLEIECGSMIM